MPQAESVLSWVHFGDLHIKREGEQNHRDFEALTDAANRHRHGSYQPPPRHADGSDRDALPAWPAKGVLGTQLGPNRNGRKW